MKTTKKSILAALVALFAISASAQQVTTLYFLENAPMRHTINPAFQPVSNGFINFSPLGWTSMSVGNNSLTVSDVLYTIPDPNDPAKRITITPLHPNGNKVAFLNQLQNMTYFNGDMTFSFINMGFRIKENGYFTLGVNEKIESGVTLPKTMFNFFLGGGMLNLNNGAINTIGLSGLGTGATAYTEISGGYSKKINDHWTVGGKLKVLLGQMYGGLNAKNLNIDASAEQWHLYGDLGLNIAGPINMEYLAQYVDGKNVRQIYESFAGNNGGASGAGFDQNKLIDFSNWPKLVIPSGYGAAIDFGFAWKPIENLQISAALTDLGFIYWTSSRQFVCSVDTIFNGVGEINYSDPKYHVNNDPSQPFSTDSLMSAVGENLKGLLNGMRMTSKAGGFVRMTSARLNVGIDANFWDNRVGVGIVSATRLYNARLYEEVTFGLAFRPVNWFNIAATYSLMNNGKYSNIGAGLGFMPYDGINLTLALDYIPTSYAALPNKDASAPKQYFLPDKAKMVNLALGFSICWGSNNRDKDKDGVWDKIDMCPETPRGVAVDKVGCPLDEDHDGVPDYLDHCLGTLPEAVPYIDSLGCDKDSDGDGVPDYLDKCPDTPEVAKGTVDKDGCPKDTDGDGVTDYLDECPNTPEAARGKVDENGCPKDSDGDGVPDYKDECPGTSAEALGAVDKNGCEKDSDGDGVPDYIDECPDTPEKAIGFVDAYGCEKDSDGDGVPDYKDECPTVPGVKENKGCPELKREVHQLLQKAMQGIEFESGKATIKQKSFTLLDQVAALFLENSNYIIEVQGHTDNVGNPELNKALSDRRAHAVMDYLIQKGVGAERLSAVGYGQDQPIADNKTKEGRQKNRRVEFKITFEEVHYETILNHADSVPAQNAE